MDIRIPTFTRDRMLRVALPSFLVAFVLAACVSWVIR